MNNAVLWIGLLSINLAISGMDNDSDPEDDSYKPTSSFKCISRMFNSYDKKDVLELAQQESSHFAASRFNITTLEELNKVTKHGWPDDTYAGMYIQPLSASVADESPTFKGFAAYLINSTVTPLLAHVTMITIKPADRRKGYAKFLLECGVIDVIAAKKGAGIFAYVFKDDSASLALFKKVADSRRLAFECQEDNAKRNKITLLFQRQNE